MENPRRHSAGSSASRRLRYLLALAGDYLKYLFMKRRRLMHKVARRTLALVHRHAVRSKNHREQWPRALMEHEFSCADSPSPAFLAAKKLLLRSRLKGSGAAAAVAGAVSSCFGSFRAHPFGSPDETMASETDQAAEDKEEDDHQLETEDDEEDDEQVLAAEDDGGWLLCGEIELDVDDRAEEFINTFYEQLRAQNFAAVFHYSP